jgi:hypothetical protein
MTWDMSRRDGPFCEGCEAVHVAGRACPGCGTKTCRRCGWCCEHADWTVTPDPSEDAPVVTSNRRKQREER